MGPPMSETPWTRVKARVIVTVAVPGWHRWPNAPDEVEYLRSKHRHIFHFKVEYATDHPDRDLEFHLMKTDVHDAIEQLFDRRNEPVGIDFGTRSCEQIAIDIGNDLRRVDRPVVAVEVWEDNENGARVEWGRS
jgi:hypothetical protein